jgi:hypothetical protein
MSFADQFIAQCPECIKTPGRLLSPKGWFHCHRCGGGGKILTNDGIIVLKALDELSQRVKKDRAWALEKAGRGEPIETAFED